MQRHPEDAYVSAELIEWIHAAEGAEAALDAIKSEIDPDAARIPFFTRYRASLLAELGRHEEATVLAEVFEAELDDPLGPAPHALRAEILMSMGRLDEAADRIETAVALDGANLSARALLGEIQSRREEG